MTGHPASRSLHVSSSAFAPAASTKTSPPRSRTSRSGCAEATSSNRWHRARTAALSSSPAAVTVATTPSQETSVRSGAVMLHPSLPFTCRGTLPGPKERTDQEARTSQREDPPGLYTSPANHATPRRSACPRLAVRTGNASAMARTRLRRRQADGHRLEQVVTTEHLAVRAGKLIESGQRVVDHTGHRTEDESLLAVPVGVDQVDNASQISSALAPDDFKRRPARVGEFGVQVAAHADLTEGCAELLAYLLPCGGATNTRPPAQRREGQCPLRLPMFSDPVAPGGTSWSA